MDSTHGVVDRAHGPRRGPGGMAHRCMAGRHFSVSASGARLGEMIARPWGSPGGDW
jgi:hypothetical protein